MLLAGVALGALYHFLTCVRRKHASATVLCDILFCCCAAAALFLLGMGPGGGELRFYMPAAVLGGAVAYYVCFSSAAGDAFMSFLDTLGKMCALVKFPLGYIGKILSRGIKNFKNIFSIARKRITIAVIAGLKPGRGTKHSKDTGNEAEKGKYLY